MKRVLIFRMMKQVSPETLQMVKNDILAQVKTGVVVITEEIELTVVEIGDAEFVPAELHPERDKNGILLRGLEA